MNEIEAAEMIVTNCRMYLSQQMRNRLQSDLVLAQQRKKCVDEEYYLANQSVIRIQKVFRGSKIRHFICRYAEKENLLYFAHAAFEGTIRFDRSIRIAELKKRRMDLLELIYFFETWLSSLLLKIQKRASNPIYNIAHSHQDSNTAWSDSMMKSWQEILNAIDDALDFAQKLRAKNDAHALRFEENLSVLLHNENVIQSIQRFLNRNNKSLPFYYNNKKLQSNELEVQRMQVACHNDLERILLRENVFVSSDTNSLLYCSQVTTNKIEYLKKLRGFEAEQRSLYTFIRNKQVNAQEAAGIVKTVDYIEEMIYRNRELLLDSYKLVEHFLIQEDQRMNSIMLFKKDGNHYEAICKILPSCEPALFDFKRWKDAYQRCIITTTDTTFDQLTVKLRDYIDEWRNTSSGSEIFSECHERMSGHDDMEDKVGVFKSFYIHRFKHFKSKYQTSKKSFITIFQRIWKQNSCVSPSIHSERSMISTVRKNLKLEENGGQLQFEDQHLLYIMDLLKITKSEFDKLKQCFDSFKNKKDETILFNNFMKSFACSQKVMEVINKLVFASFEPPKDLRLNFGEFARGLCSFCIMSKSDIVRRTFYGLDTLNYGYISNEQLQEFINSMHSNDSISLEILKNELVNQSYSLNDFISINHRYPLLMFPVFKCREIIQDLLLSKQTFQKKAKQLKAA